MKAMRVSFIFHRDVRIVFILVILGDFFSTKLCAKSATHLTEGDYYTVARRVSEAERGKIFTNGTHHQTRLIPFDQFFAWKN